MDGNRPDSGSLQLHLTAQKNEVISSAQRDVKSVLSDWKSVPARESDTK